MPITITWPTPARAARSPEERAIEDRRSPALARWLRRYGPAEAVGTATALLGAALVAGGDVLVAGAVAAWSENLGFYGAMVAGEIGGRMRGGDRRTTIGIARTTVAAVGALAVEFGPAELLDSPVARPALMAAALRLLPDPRAGVIAGKLAADLVFYVLVILIWEWRRAAARSHEHGRQPTHRERT